MAFSHTDRLHIAEITIGKSGVAGHGVRSEPSLRLRLPDETR